MRLLTHRHVAALLALALALPLGFAATAGAGQAPVPLGTAANFSILAYSGITNVSTSVISGDVGLSPAAGSFITGLPCSEVAGTVYAVDATGLPCYTNNPGLLTAAKNSLTNAYNVAEAQTPTGSITGVNLAGQTLIPGVYNSTGSILISGPTPLTLNGQGNNDSVWIFQAAAAGDLTVAPTSRVVYTNGAQPCNVFWKVQSAFLQNTGFTFVGTILALTQITLTSNITVHGRVLARNADVTLISDTITKPGSCISQSDIDAANAAAQKAVADAQAAVEAAAAAAAAAATAAAAVAAEIARVEAAKAVAAANVARAAAAKVVATAKAAQVAKALATAKAAAKKAAVAKAAAVKAAKKALAGGSTSVGGPALPPVNPSGFTG